MSTPKIFESEYRFCLILWEHEPLPSAELAKLCKERLGWSRTPTYTVIHRLGERGIVKNENGLVSSLVSKDEAQAAELDALLKGGKINRVSQADKDEVTFIIYTGKTTVKLVLSTNASNARVCLSLTEKEPAPVAPNFCMLLRKHLLGAEILSVSQYAFERIVEIRMHCTTDFSECERVLHCEIMGKYSNLILTERGVILGALKTSSLEDNARRVLLAGAKYAYPEPQDKLSPFDGEGLKERTESFLSLRSEGASDEELARFLFENVAGLALPTARELLRFRPRETPVWKFVGEFCENTKTKSPRIFSPSPSRAASSPRL